MTNNEHIAYQLIARLDVNDVLDAEECAANLATFLDEVSETRGADLVTTWIADQQAENLKREFTRVYPSSQRIESEV